MSAISPDTMTTLDEIIDNFALLEEWDDRYRYVIELGRGLSPLSEQDRTDLNKVQGCASQVWLATTVRPNGPDGPALTFQGDSDAHIVRGLIAILFAMFSGKPAQDILSFTHPCHGVHLQRMGRKQECNESAWPYKPRHPIKQIKQERGVYRVKQQIDDMMGSGLESKNLAVQHM